MKFDFKILVILGFLLIVLLLGYFSIIPNFEKIKLLRDDITKLQAQREAILDANKKIVELTPDYQKYQEEIEKLDAMLSSEKDVQILLSDFDYLVSVNGLVLKNILVVPFSSQKSLTDGRKSLQSESSEKELGGLAVTIDVQGSYQALKNFLASIEKDPRFLELTEMSLNFSEKEELMSANLKFKTFILEE